MMLRILFIVSLLHISTAVLPPIDLSAVEVSTHSLKFAWNASDLRAKFFEAILSPLNDTEDKNVESNKFLDKPFATWFDLIPGKLYTASVICIAEDGTESLPVQLSVATTPMPPFELKKTRFINPILSQYRMDGGRIMRFPVHGEILQWKGPDVGRKDGFTLTVDPPHGIVRLLNRKDGSRPQSSDRQRLVWDLRPGVYYNFGVATTSNGMSSEVATVGERMTPEVPGEIKVEAVAPTRVTLSWDEPHRGFLDGFVVEVNPVETSEVLKPDDPTVKRRTITGLTPGTIYNVDVYSTSVGVWSYKAQSVAIKTPPATPLKPVKDSDITTNSVRVSWKRPSGRLDYYELVYWPTLRDFSRLRHRISDPTVQLVNLRPDTQYSLMIFSVSNQLHSRPLRAVVRTASNVTTTPPPATEAPFVTMAFQAGTSTTDVAVLDVTAQNPEEEVSKFIHIERFSTTTVPPDLIDLTTTDSYSKTNPTTTSTTAAATTTTAATTTSRKKLEYPTTPPPAELSTTPEPLPPHHSIPYAEPTIETFPSTQYITGRTTQMPPTFTDETTTVEPSSTTPTTPTSKEATSTTAATTTTATTTTAAITTTLQSSSAASTTSKHTTASAERLTTVRITPEQPATTKPPTQDQTTTPRDVILDSTIVTLPDLKTTTDHPSIATTTLEPEKLVESSTTKPTTIESTTKMLSAATTTQQDTQQPSTTAPSPQQPSTIKTTTKKENYVKTTTTTDQPDVVATTTTSKKTDEAVTTTTTDQPDVVATTTASKKTDEVVTTTTTDQPDIVATTTASKKTDEILTTTTTDQPDVVATTTASKKTDEVETATTTDQPDVVATTTASKKTDEVETTTTTDQPGVVATTTASKKTDEVETTTTTDRPAATATTITEKESAATTTSTSTLQSTTQKPVAPQTTEDNNFTTKIQSASQTTKKSTEEESVATSAAKTEATTNQRSIIKTTPTELVPEEISTTRSDAASSTTAVVAQSTATPPGDAEITTVQIDTGKTTSKQQTTRKPVISEITTAERIVSESTTKPSTSGSSEAPDVSTVEPTLVAEIITTTRPSSPDANSPVTTEAPGKLHEFETTPGHSTTTTSVASTTSRENLQTTSPDNSLKSSTSKPDKVHTTKPNDKPERTTAVDAEQSTTRAIVTFGPPKTEKPVIVEATPPAVVKTTTDSATAGSATQSEITTSSVDTTPSRGSGKSTTVASSPSSTEGQQTFTTANREVTSKPKKEITTTAVDGEMTSLSASSTTAGTTTTTTERTAKPTVAATTKKSDTTKPVEKTATPQGSASTTEVSKQTPEAVTTSEREASTKLITSSSKSSTAKTPGPVDTTTVAEVTKVATTVPERSFTTDAAVETTKISSTISTTTDLSEETTESGSISTTGKDKNIQTTPTGAGQTAASTTSSRISSSTDGITKEVKTTQLNPDVTHTYSTTAGNSASSVPTDNPVPSVKPTSDSTKIPEAATTAQQTRATSASVRETATSEKTTVPRSEVTESQTTTQVATKTTGNTKVPGVSTTRSTTASTTDVPEKETIPIDTGYETLCKPNNITIFVDKSVIGKYEKQYGPLHFNDYDDPACRGVEHETYYRYTIAPNLRACGMEVELNGTHVNYTNVVSNSRQRHEWLKIRNESTGTVLVGREISNGPNVFVHINVWCTFPVDVNVSVPFLPEIKIEVLTFNVSGRGQFSAMMQLYKTSDYVTPYSFAPRLEADDMLHVGVTLLESEDPLTFLVVKRCWATPERSSDHPTQYPLIEESCIVPSSLDGSLRILENGISKRARWEGSVFKFVNYGQVWLHCEIQVCFGEGCEKDCNARDKRVRRSENDVPGHILSAGPINVGNRVNLTTEPNSGTTAVASGSLDKTTVLILVISLCAVIVICLIVIACVVTRLRRQRRRHKNLSPMTSPNHLSNVPYPLSSAESGQSSVQVSRANSNMSTFRGGRPTRERPPIAALSSGSYGKDNGAYFSSTTELRQAEEDSSDFPAPPPEVLSSSDYVSVHSNPSFGSTSKNYHVLT